MFELAAPHQRVRQGSSHQYRAIMRPVQQGTSQLPLIYRSLMQDFAHGGYATSRAPKNRPQEQISQSPLSLSIKFPSPYNTDLVLLSFELTFQLQPVSGQRRFGK